MRIGPRNNDFDDCCNCRRNIGGPQHQTALLSRSTKTKIFFPSVVVKNSADTDFFTGTSAITDTDLPLLIDIDDEAPNPNNGVDGCCWPSLDALRALITAVK